MLIQKIRELSDGKKSLDDFAKLFYGVYNGCYLTFTYHFDDVVKTLNTVAPFDWNSFLKETRLRSSSRRPKRWIHSRRLSTRLHRYRRSPGWRKQRLQDTMPTSRPHAGSANDLNKIARSDSNTMPTACPPSFSCAIFSQHPRDSPRGVTLPREYDHSP
jgi:hypothetical protein